MSSNRRGSRKRNRQEDAEEGMQGWAKRTRSASHRPTMLTVEESGPALMSSPPGERQRDLPYFLGSTRSSDPEHTQTSMSNGPWFLSSTGSDDSFLPLSIANDPNLMGSVPQPSEPPYVQTGLDNPFSAIGISSSPFSLGNPPQSHGQSYPQIGFIDPSLSTSTANDPTFRRSAPQSSQRSYEQTVLNDPFLAISNNSFALRNPPQSYGQTYSQTGLSDPLLTTTTSNEAPLGYRPAAHEPPGFIPNRRQEVNPVQEKVRQRLETKRSKSNTVRRPRLGKTKEVDLVQEEVPQRPKMTRGQRDRALNEQLEPIEDLESRVEQTSSLDAYEVSRMKEILRNSRRRIRSRDLMRVDPTASARGPSLAGRVSSVLTIHEGILLPLLKGTKLTAAAIDTMVNSTLSSVDQGNHEVHLFEGPMSLDSGLNVNGTERIWRIHRADLEGIFAGYFNDISFAQQFVRLMISAERTFHSNLPEMLSDSYVMKLHESVLKISIAPLLLAMDELDPVVFALRGFSSRIELYSGEDVRAAGLRNGDFEKVWLVPRDELATIIAQNATCFCFLPTELRQQEVSKLLNEIERREQLQHGDWEPRTPEEEEPGSGKGTWKGRKKADDQSKILETIVRKGWGPHGQIPVQGTRRRTQRWPPYLQFLQEMGYLRNLKGAKPLTNKEMVVRYGIQVKSGHSAASKYLKRAVIQSFGITNWNEFTNIMFPGKLKTHQQGVIEALKMFDNVKYQEVEMAALEEERKRLGIQKSLQQILNEQRQAQQSKQSQLSQLSKPSEPSAEEESQDELEDSEDEQSVQSNDGDDNDDSDDYDYDDSDDEDYHD